MFLPTARLRTMIWIFAGRVNEKDATDTTNCAHDVVLWFNMFSLVTSLRKPRKLPLPASHRSGRARGRHGRRRRPTPDPRRGDDLQRRVPSMLCARVSLASLLYRSPSLLSSTPLALSFSIPLSCTLSFRPLHVIWLETETTGSRGSRWAGHGRAVRRKWLPMHR